MYSATAFFALASLRVAGLANWPFNLGFFSVFNFFPAGFSYFLFADFVSFGVFRSSSSEPSSELTKSLSSSSISTSDSYSSESSLPSLYLSLTSSSPVSFNTFLSSSESSTKSPELKPGLLAFRVRLGF